jgi:hypothetical protein
LRWAEEVVDRDLQEAYMTSTRSRAGLVTCLIPSVVCLLAACGRTPDTRQASAPAPATPATIEVTSPVSINAVMVRVVDHAAHRLWDVERDGMAPRTDADWETLEEHATQVAAAGALIRLEGTGVNDRTFVQQKDWQTWAKTVSDAGLDAFKAAEGRNLQGLVVANGKLVDACEGCHKRFKPAIPSEGITHTHVH